MAQHARLREPRRPSHVLGGGKLAGFSWLSLTWCEPTWRPKMVYVAVILTGGGDSELEMPAMLVAMGQLKVAVW